MDQDLQNFTLLPPRPFVLSMVAMPRGFRNDLPFRNRVAASSRGPRRRGLAGHIGTSETWPRRTASKAFGGRYGVSMDQDRFIIASRCHRVVGRREDAVQRDHGAAVALGQRGPPVVEGKGENRRG